MNNISLKIIHSILLFVLYHPQLEIRDFMLPVKVAEMSLLKSSMVIQPKSYQPLPNYRTAKQRRFSGDQFLMFHNVQSVLIQLL
jgi:hypothetical protein